MKKPLLFVALLLAAAACSKDKSEPSIDFGPNGGFTVRTNNNLPDGPHDPTDWTSDASWNEREQKLFAGLNLSLTGPQLPANTWEFSWFPNPSQLNGSCLLGIQPYNTHSTHLPANPMRLSIAMVDLKYNIVDAGDIDMRTNELRISYNLDPAKFTANKLYRLYYVLYEPGKQVYCRGHGDIKIQ